MPASDIKMSESWIMIPNDLKFQRSLKSKIKKT